MFKLANDVSYITWVTLQSPPWIDLELVDFGGLSIKSFSFKLSAEVFAISCRRILASSHDLDAVLFIMNLVVTNKCYWCREYENSILKLKIPSRMIAMWKTQHGR